MGVIVEKITDIKIPWLTMVAQLATVEGDQVVWKSCLHRDEKLKSDGSNLGLYTNQSQLELIFHRLDADGSGLVTIPELRQVATVLNGMKSGGESKQAKDLQRTISIRCCSTWTPTAIRKSVFL